MITRVPAENIVIKRIYELYGADDGERILVDRLWPRGVSKEDAKMDDWLRSVAPSDELRKWFNHEAGKWPEFLQRYSDELQVPEKAFLVAGLKRKASVGKVTLLYSARNETRNNAVALRAILLGKVNR